MQKSITPKSGLLVLAVAILTPATSACSTSPEPTTLPAATPPATVVPTTTTAQPSGKAVIVPGVTAPVIDGVLDDAEWAGAASFEMSDGAPLRLMQADGTLYVSAAGSELGSVNVVLGTGDEVWILHSSAALGSARYTPGSDAWELAHGFSWCCRDGGTTSRLALLEEEGWQANIGFTGTPGVVEFQISLPWTGASIAVSTVRSAEDRGFWPAELSVEARLQLVGPPPPTRAFTIEEWMVLTAPSD